MLIFINILFAASFCTGLNIISKGKNNNFRGFLLFVKEIILELCHCMPY